jgi:hypothetical protein
LFFFKQKPVVLDAFTSRADVLATSKMVKGTHFLPDWWKRLPKDGVWEPTAMFPSTTMRNCVGLFEFYTKSIVLPMWSDLAINLPGGNDSSYTWQFADYKSSADVHGKEQHKGFLESNRYAHLKIYSPWSVKCKEDISFLSCNPFWNNQQPEEIIITPGVSNFKYQHSTNAQLFLVRGEQTKTLMIRHGNPLLMLFPLTERPVKIRHHLVTEEELKRIHIPIVSFVKNYFASKKVRSCPYNRG